MEESLGCRERCHKDGLPGEHQRGQVDSASQRHPRRYSDGNLLFAHGKWWLLHYGLGEQVSYSIKLYGIDSATRLALAWTYRMQAYLDIFKESGDEGLVYTKGLLDSYKEEP